MKILITGSEGFVGRNLIKSLSMCQHEIVGFDRLQSVNGEYNAVRIDLDQPINLSYDSYDVLIHCAAAKGDWNIAKSEFYRDNVLVTQNVLNYIKNCNIKKIIHFSTVAIYSRKTIDGSERTEINPDSVYGETKLESEKLVYEFAKCYGVPTVVLRPSVIYGQDNFANMFNLIEQLNRGLPFQIDPNGITKSHVSVRNVVDVVSRFINSSQQVGGTEIYNLTERPYTNLTQMITIICEELAVAKPRINLPLVLAYPLFGIMEAFGKLVQKDIGFTLDRLNKFSSSTNYTSEKLWSQIGEQKYSTDSELRSMVCWYKNLKK